MLNSPDSDLVILTTDDSLDAALSKVRQSTAANVSILVPDGVTIFQSMGACDKLRQLGEKNGKEIAIYSADEKTCNAAQLCKLPVVRVGAPVTPGDGGGRRSTGAHAARPAAAPAADPFSMADAAPSPGPRGMGALAKDDDPFRDELDDDWASALNEFSQVAIGDQQRPAARESEDWANAFDDLSDAMSGGSGSGSGTGRFEAAPAAPQRRFRPEDIELDEADMARNTRRKPEKKAGPLAAITGMLGGLLSRRGRSADDDEDGDDVRPARSAASDDTSEEDQEERDAQRRRYNSYAWGAIALILLLVAALYFLGRDTPSLTVQVAPPANASGVQPYDNLIIPFEAVGVTPLEVPAEANVVGQITEQTIAPINPASGVIDIANTNTQEITLVRGQAVLGPTGQRYVLDSDVVIPAAVASFTGFTNGIGSAPISAVSAGPDYNLPAGTPMTIEGYALLAQTQTSIEGGDAQPVFLVTQELVNARLGDALPQLVSQAQGNLTNQAAASNQGIIGTSFTPTLELLSTNPELYQIETVPPIGSPSPDGTFTVRVTANFLALAGPSGQNMDETLRNLVGPELTRLKNLTPDTFDFTLNDYQLTPDHILVSGEIIPIGGEGQIAEDVLKDIGVTLGGLSRAEAEQLLQQYQDMGIIGDFVLPADIQTLPAAAEIEVEEIR